MTTRTLKNFVNGSYQESRAKEALDLVDPATEEVYATSPISNAGRCGPGLSGSGRCV
jgi:betaine-aldehyde dehydrogenase